MQRTAISIGRALIVKSFPSVEADSQTLQKLPVLETDLVQPLLDVHFPFFGRLTRSIYGPAWWILEGDGRLEHKKDLVSGLTYAVEGVVDRLCIVGRAVDRLAQLSNQPFELFIHGLPHFC